MVLESLINPAAAKRKPWETFLLGALYASVGLFLAFWVFREYSSLIMVFLTTLAAVPFFYFTVRGEEKIDAGSSPERTVLREHSRVLLFLIFLFLGMTISLALWYVFLPSAMVVNIFSAQSQTITAINNQISGGVTQFEIFVRILLNNLRVLVFSILFAFLYGMGALFILTWNASVIAAAMGNFIRKNLALTAGTVGLEKVGAYLNIFSLGFFRYAIHGIPEVLAYFIGGLAGGIISVAIINHDIFREKSERIILDVAELVLLAVAVLFLAALIEVYITPSLF